MAENLAQQAKAKIAKTSASFKWVRPEVGQPCHLIRLPCRRSAFWQTRLTTPVLKAGCWGILQVYPLLAVLGVGCAFCAYSFGRNLMHNPGITCELIALFVRCAEPYSPLIDSACAVSTSRRDLESVSSQRRKLENTISLSTDLWLR